MEAFLGLPALLLVALLGSGSVKITSGGRSRLVERLGKFDRELQPGLSFVLPMVEKVTGPAALEASTQCLILTGAGQDRSPVLPMVEKVTGPAALEASTQCLILTGAGQPLPQLISRAEELEVPLLKVDHDTVSTVEVIEQAFGHVRLHEAVKATYSFRLVEEHCYLDRLFDVLGLPMQGR